MTSADTEMRTLKDLQADNLCKIGSVYLSENLLMLVTGLGPLGLGPLSIIIYVDDPSDWASTFGYMVTQPMYRTYLLARKSLR